MRGQQAYGFTRVTGGRLDVLFNNAGIGTGGPIATASFDEIDRTVAINFTGVLNGARIGKGCLVGAGALVTEGKEFPDHSLILGSPAKVVRTLTQEDLLRLEGTAASYVARGQLFKAQLKKIG